LETTVLIYQLSDPERMVTGREEGREGLSMGVWMA